MILNFPLFLLSWNTNHQYCARWSESEVLNRLADPEANLSFQRERSVLSKFWDIHPWGIRRDRVKIFLMLTLSIYSACKWLNGTDENTYYHKMLKVWGNKNDFGIRALWNRSNWWSLPQKHLNPVSPNSSRVSLAGISKSGNRVREEVLMSTNTHPVKETMWNTPQNKQVISKSMHIVQIHRLDIWKLCSPIWNLKTLLWKTFWGLFTSEVLWAMVQWS